MLVTPPPTSHSPKVSRQIRPGVPSQGVTFFLFRNQIRSSCLGQMHLWLPSRSCMLPALLDLSNVHQHSPPLGLLILPGICYRIITWKLQGRPSASGLHPDQKGREKVTGTVICEQSTGKCSHKPWEALGEKILNTYSSLMIESRLNQCQREREGGGERPHGSPQDQGLKINVSRTDGVIVL